MATGTTTIDFGAFPGAYSATVAVTGQASITGSSLVEAWIVPTATSDHSADEHLIDPPRVMAGNVVAGTGFTIYGFPRDDWQINRLAGSEPITGRTAPKPYGQWTVAWAWA